MDVRSWHVHCLGRSNAKLNATTNRQRLNASDGRQWSLLRSGSPSLPVVLLRSKILSCKKASQSRREQNTLVQKKCRSLVAGAKYSRRKSTTVSSQEQKRLSAASVFKNHTSRFFGRRLTILKPPPRDASRSSNRRLVMPHDPQTAAS